MYIERLQISGAQFSPVSVAEVVDHHLWKGDHAHPTGAAIRHMADVREPVEKIEPDLRDGDLFDLGELRIIGMTPYVHDIV